MMKSIIAFDLDGTLAKSKQAVDDEMADLLSTLLALVTVVVMSGGDWPQFQRQLLPHLAHAALDRLIIMPTSGTKMYRHTSQWQPVYAELFSDQERRRVLDAMHEAAAAIGSSTDPSWGDRIEDRGSQITFSGLGQLAPLKEKLEWDPNRTKRQQLKTVLDRSLSGFSVTIGGSTSVDVTREGIDKGYGIGRLIEETGSAASAILFVGDALYPGGNDEPVRRTGVTTIAVRDIEETKRVIEAITACV
jgi:hypothetical protein